MIIFIDDGGGAPAPSTWDTAASDPQMTFSGGDLIATMLTDGTYLGSAIGEQSHDASEDHSYEVTIGGVDNLVVVGVCPGGSDPSGYPGQATGYGYFGPGLKYPGGAAYGAAYAVGDVITVQVKANDVIFWVNGVSQGVAFSGIAAGAWFPMCGVGTPGTNGQSRSFTLAVTSLAYLPAGSTEWG